MKRDIEELFDEIKEHQMEKEAFQRFTKLRKLVTQSYSLILDNEKKDTENYSSSDN